MSAAPWIICERSNGWAAALRIALARKRDASPRPALHEVRSITELSVRVGEFPQCLVLIEVTPKNLDAALAWFADLDFWRPAADGIALLDREFSNIPDVAAVLREAGAAEVVLSRRDFEPALRFARGPCRTGYVGPNRTSKNPSLRDWAWSLLPWQNASRPLG